MSVLDRVLANDKHSPDEKIHIERVGKYWKFLLGILKNVT